MRRQAHDLYTQVVWFTHISSNRRDIGSAVRLSALRCNADKRTYKTRVGGRGSEFCELPPREHLSRRSDSYALAYRERLAIAPLGLPALSPLRYLGDFIGELERNV